MLVVHFLCELLLVHFILFHEFIDLFLFFVEDFVLLHILIVVACLVIKVAVNFFDVTSVLVYNFPHLGNFLVRLLDLSIFFLDTAHETFPCLWEWQIRLICLQFKVFFLFHQLGLVFTEVLSPLLESILIQAVFRFIKPLRDFI